MRKDTAMKAVHQPTMAEQFEEAILDSIQLTETLKKTLEYIKASSNETMPPEDIIKGLKVQHEAANQHYKSLEGLFAFTFDLEQA